VGGVLGNGRFFIFVLNSFSFSLVIEIRLSSLARFSFNWCFPMSKLREVRLGEAHIDMRGVCAEKHIRQVCEMGPGMGINHNWHKKSGKR